MEIKANEIDGVNVVEISGRLDATSCTEADSFFNQLIAANKVNVLIDCKQLDYISSAGLRVFLSVAKQLKRLSGKIGLAELNQNVNQIIEISGFTKIFPIFKESSEGTKKLLLS